MTPIFSTGRKYKKPAKKSGLWKWNGKEVALDTLHPNQLNYITGVLTLNKQAYWYGHKADYWLARIDEIKERDQIITESALRMEAKVNQFTDRFLINLPTEFPGKLSNDCRAMMLEEQGVLLS